MGNWVVKIQLRAVFVVLLAMLMFASVFGSISSINIQSTTKTNTETTSSMGYSFTNGEQADLPEWSIGHFWEYDLSLYFAGLVSINVARMDVRVTDINDYENEYTVSLNGYLDKVELSGYDYSELMTALCVSGNAHINKSTLSMKDFSLILSGNSQGSLKIDFNIIMKMEFDPDLDFFDFPIIADEEDRWNIANVVDFIITGYVKISGEEIFTIDEKSLDNSINDELSVTSKENIDVSAGDFESFLISGKLGDPSELWYSPEVGYLVKVDQHIPKFLKMYVYIGFGCYLELLSTNFNHPDNNAPNMPEISGPTSGKAGEEHEYTVSTSDPNGEQVYYKIDWGDGTCSDWLGPYASGDDVIVKHTWTNKAIYKIRAKAKDENGYQTAWSDPLSISMPKSKQLINLEPGIYVDNAQKVPFPITIPLIVGWIDIEVDAEGANKVEFYIDGVKKDTDYDSPYIWTWDEFSFGRHTLMVITYDNTGNSDTDEMTVWKFF